MKNLASSTFWKALSPKIFSRAIQTFDRATMVVVVTSWAAGVVMMLFAIYTVSLASNARLEAEKAMAIEPNLPKIARKAIDPKAAQVVVDRMQRRFSDITFSLRGSNISVSSLDGTKFRQWLMALGYIDTISPEFHWSIQEFCAGKCPGNDLMRATLVGERITFQAPQPD